MHSNGTLARRAFALMGCAATLALASAAPANAFYQRYVRSAIFTPGTSASSSWNRLTYNSTQWTSCCGGPASTGTKYVRADGTSVSWLWSTSGAIFDSRSIAYGQALCGAWIGNRYAAHVSFCDTGNG